MTYSTFGKDVCMSALGCCFLLNLSRWTVRTHELVCLRFQVPIDVFLLKLLLFERSSEWVCGFEYLSSYDFSEIMCCGKALTWTDRHTCFLLIFLFDFFSLKAFISSSNSNGRRLTLRIWDNSKQTAGKCNYLLSMRFKALPWTMWHSFSCLTVLLYFFFFTNPCCFGSLSVRFMFKLSTVPDCAIISAELLFW